MSKDIGCTLTEARLRASKKLPYLTTDIMSMVPILRPGLGTMGVDKYRRLYYDPEFLAQRTIQDAAWIVLHEEGHIALRHCQRFENHICTDSPAAWQAAIWNLAADCSVNSGFLKGVPGQPKDATMPDKFGLPPSMGVEWYYDEMCRQHGKGGTLDQTLQGMMDLFGPQVAQGTQGEGQEGEGGGQNAPGQPYGGQAPRPGCGSGGSSADGQLKPWEIGAPAKTGVPGVESKTDQERLERVLAQAFHEHKKQHGCGNTPADFQRMTSEIIKPSIDPLAEIQAVVRHAMNASTGFGDYTWKKIPRRTVPGIRLPTHVRPIPRIAMCIDTSGSMGQEDLELALGAIAGVLRSLPTGHVEILAGDTQVHAIGRVSSAEAVRPMLRGGGGTDMGRMVDAAAETECDLILVVTDGETGWNDEEPRQKVVACLTSSRSKNYPTPSWMEVVELNPDE